MMIVGAGYMDSASFAQGPLLLLNSKIRYAVEQSAVQQSTGESG